MLHCIEWTQYKDGLRFPVRGKYNYLLYCFFNNNVSSSDYTMSNGFFFSMARQSLVGQGLFTVEASPSHSVTNTTLGKTPTDE
jgi:hypothetical protein